MPRLNWKHLEELFARACALPESEREPFAVKHCANDPVLCSELLTLLRADTAVVASGFLEAPPLLGDDTTVELQALAAGSRLGAWCIARPLGRGGMGEVYDVFRADGTFEQRAALKLLRREAVAQIERFHAERNILGRLDYPGIARLLDGGVAADGRPWAVLEYVEGRPITAWCALHNADLSARLGLFVQVCEAVAYAHRNLIVHRDLKPSNILVDTTGRVRLLDFGIAKLLDPESGTASEVTQLPLTLDYCAPEQLAGEAVTTATDTYALGVLLHELLTGSKPWSAQGLPLARAVRMLTETPAPKLSHAARANPAAPVPAHLLQGDLDAIVARALRKEPVNRYSTVDAFKQDIDCYQQGRTVAARGGARMYIFGRMLHRHRWAVAAVATLIVALVAGLAGTYWQARRAEAQAARAEAEKQRAEATKNFLVGVFKASDPGKASDKPRGGITARELLDQSSARIEKDFAFQPELQIELLGITADIFHELNEPDRYATLHSRYMELARQHYGESHPIMIDAYLQEANFAADRRNTENARLILDQTDALIQRAGLDKSAVRARWWVIEAATLPGDSAGQSKREELLTRAVELFENTDPHHTEYVDALMILGNIYGASRGDYARGHAFHLRAKAAQAQLPDRNDAEAAIIEFNLAIDAVNRGDFAEAAATYEQAANLYLRTYGERNHWYWVTLSEWAHAACNSGDRTSAQQLFDRISAVLPATPNEDESHYVARTQLAHGSCLVAEGRPLQAVSFLEAAEKQQISQPSGGFISLPATRRILGDAYAQTGRNEDARRVLKLALDGLLSRVAPKGELDNFGLLLLRECWGRFLLTQGETAEAEIQFREILAQDHGRNFSPTALAYAGLAQVALRHDDAGKALQASTQALHIFSNVSGYRSVYVEPTLWRVHAQALARTGDIAAAKDYAQRALDAFTRYSDPASNDIAESAAVVVEVGKLAKR